MEEWRRLVEGGICELEDIDTLRALHIFSLSEAVEVIFRNGVKKSIGGGKKDVDTYPFKHLKSQFCHKVHTI
jgi:hypothetical protein